MEIIDLLRKCFGANAVAVLLGSRQNLPSPIRKQFFADGGQWPLASISMAELRSLITNIPVVRRGTTAYSLDRGKDGLMSIEPQGIDMSDFISAAALNNLKVLGLSGVQAYANGIMNRMMNTAQVTTEALCAQALTGVIAYPMKSEGGQLDVYGVDYGTPTALPDADLTKAGTTIMDVYTLLDDLHKALQMQGYGGSVSIAAGSQAFATILKRAENSKSNILQVNVSVQGEVNIGGYTIKLQSGMHKDFDQSMVPNIPANALVAVDTSAGSCVKYLALDDITNGLQPMPFATTTEVLNNPSGMEIVGRSKPLPIVAVGAIVWVKVLPDTEVAKVKGRLQMVKSDRQTSMADVIRARHDKVMSEAENTPEVQDHFGISFDPSKLDAQRD
ncbi:major capsid protein [Enterobacter kobei]